MKFIVAAASAAAMAAFVPAIAQAQDAAAPTVGSPSQCVAPSGDDS